MDNTAASTTSTLAVGGNDETSTFSGIIGNSTGTLGLTKTGTGTLTLSGALNYSGATLVSAGKLVVPSTHTGTGAATVSANATLGVTVSGTSQWQPASLTLADPCTLEFNSVQNPGTTTAPLLPTAAVGTVSGVTININSISGTVLVGNSYPLLGNQGGTTNGYTLGTQPPGVTGRLAVSGTTLVYIVETAPDIWTGADGTNPTWWDIATTANWTGKALNNTPAGSYADGDGVLFDDTASPASPVTVALQTAVAPGNMIFQQHQGLHRHRQRGVRHRRQRQSDQERQRHADPRRLEHLQQLPARPPSTPAPCRSPTTTRWAPRRRHHHQRRQWHYGQYPQFDQCHHGPDDRREYQLLWKCGRARPIVQQQRSEPHPDR